MKNITKLLSASLLTIILFTAVHPFSKAQNSQVIQQPGYYNLQVGDLPVVILSDGTLPLDMGKLLSHAHPGEIEEAYQRNFLTPNVESSTNVYLVRSGDKLILIDAGAGMLFGPTLGQLTKSLANAGFKPEQIDAVLITHMHPDHVGGLSNNGNIVFPNATVYIEKAESDYWLNEQNKNKAPDMMKPFFDYAQNAVSPYAKAGKLKTFAYGTTLFPGITALASAGHTPGHTSFAVESKGEKFLILGDLVHAMAVQFKDPAVTIKFDNDEQAAFKARKKFFDEAVQGKYLIAASHLPFPGFGHIRSDKQSYIWFPANYSTIAAK